MSRKKSKQSRPSQGRTDTVEDEMPDHDIDESGESVEDAEGQAESERARRRSGVAERAPAARRSDAPPTGTGRAEPDATRQPVVTPLDR